MIDPIGDRIKGYYEERASTKLVRKIPVIMRLDGKAFHTLTAKFCDTKGFDDTFTTAMDETAVFLLKNIQGAKVAYVQSDEISLVLTDYDTLETDAWFDYKVQKMCSVSASMASVSFNYIFFETRFGDILPNWKTGKIPTPIEMGMFDSRCFNMPKDDVMNYLIWRQKDCTRNSLNTYSRLFFSAKEVSGKGVSDRHEMLHTIGKNWATDLSARYKNGCFFYKKKVLVEDKLRSEIFTLTETIDYSNEELNQTFNF